MRAADLKTRHSRRPAAHSAYASINAASTWPAAAAAAKWATPPCACRALAGIYTNRNAHTAEPPGLAGYEHGHDPRPGPFVYAFPAGPPGLPDFNGGSRAGRSSTPAYRGLRPFFDPLFDPPPSNLIRSSVKVGLNDIGILCTLLHSLLLP